MPPFLVHRRPSTDRRSLPKEPHPSLHHCLCWHTSEHQRTESSRVCQTLTLVKYYSVKYNVTCQRISNEEMSPKRTYQAEELYRRHVDFFSIYSILLIFKPLFTPRKPFVTFDPDSPRSLFACTPKPSGKHSGNKSKLGCFRAVKNTRKSTTPLRLILNYNLGHQTTVTAMVLARSKAVLRIQQYTAHGVLS